MQSVALGSCVAVAVFDRSLKVGGLVHIMLPGRSPKSSGQFKYAEDGIEALLDSTQKLGVENSDLEVSVVGGGNVLKEGDIPDKIIESVLLCLKGLSLEIKGMRVGGVKRRSIFLDTSSGKVHYTEGDAITRVLLTKIERV